MRRYVFSECFAAIAMSEYAKAVSGKLGRDACPQASADGTYPPSEASRVSGR